MTVVLRVSANPRLLSACLDWIHQRHQMGFLAMIQQIHPQAVFRRVNKKFKLDSTGLELQCDHVTCHWAAEFDSSRGEIEKIMMHSVVHCKGQQTVQAGTGADLVRGRVPLPELCWI
jgi:hypothetical protein